MILETLFATYAVTSAAVGGGMGFMAISNLLTGAFNRSQQRKEAQLQRKFSDELQQRQLAFQEKLQARNFVEAERLQKEIVQIQFANSLSLQQQNFDSQMRLWERTAFIQNEWPLISTPEHYVERLKNSYSTGKLPLQIIIPDSLPDFLTGMTSHMATFFHDAYSLHDNTPVFYYDKGWKESMRKRDGNAQMIALHDALAGLPTLILIPQIAGNIFTIRASFWGLGDIELPENKELFSINLKDLDTNILRADADDQLAFCAQYNLQTPEDNNIKIRQNELNRNNELLQQGLPADVARLVLSREFDSQYSKKGKEDLLNQSREQFLSAILEVSGAAIADIYHLIEFKASPTAPLLCNRYPFFKQAAIQSLLQEIYRDIALNNESFYLDKPLYCALIADSFAKSKQQDAAEFFVQETINLLQKMYPDMAAMQMSSHHILAINILKNNHVELPHAQNKLLESIEITPDSPMDLALPNITVVPLSKRKKTKMF